MSEIKSKRIYKPPPKCQHNKNKHNCRKCFHLGTGGKNTCEHTTNKYTCKKCNSNTQCPNHPKTRKAYCIPCKGTNVCSHDRLKSQCTICKPCPHGKRKTQCPDCDGSYICEHKQQKYECFHCGTNAPGRCKHNKRQRDCSDCLGKNICKHKKYIRHCTQCCTPCPHGKTKKERCLKCSPNTKEFCVNCRLFHVTKRTNYLCNYCRPDSTKHQKTREIQVKTLLEKHQFEFIHNKQFTNECCLKYRPDFLMDCGTYYLILEVDEYAHSSYEQDCEIIRMNNITSGLGLPVKWIRYNPDHKDFTKTIKEKTLIQTIQKWINLYYCHDLNIEYLFYPTRPI